MNYQPLILTCECGYRTPEAGKNGYPLTERNAQRAYQLHRFWRHGEPTAEVPRRRVYRVRIVCPLCNRARTVQRQYPQPLRCRSCSARVNGLNRHAYLDEMAVERLLSGIPVNATAADRAAAVHYLTEHGMSAKEIAARLRIAERTVVRLRARVAA